MISSGTLAATVPDLKVAGVNQALTDLGTPFAFVGRVVPGIGVRILQGDKMEHYTEIHCEHDELARIWSLYPRDV